MNLQEFKEKYNNAPYTMNEFAEGASLVIDAGTLSGLADNYLEAKEAFEAELTEVGIELG